MKEVLLDEMWLVIERSGIKRKVLEMTSPTEEEIKHLYLLVKKRKRYTKEQEFIRLLKEYVEKITSLNQTNHSETT